MMHYAHSTWGKAFEGCAAVGRRTLSAFVTGLLGSWIFQGIHYFIVIDGAADNQDGLSEAIKRACAANPVVRCIVLDWQNHPEVRAFISARCPGPEYGPSQFGILSMASFLDKEFTRAPSEKQQPLLATDEHYRRWRKTGSDPEKFRKLFPSASTSSAARDFDAPFGEELFNTINGVFQGIITDELGW
jgi:hypothetical protein